MVQIVVHLNKNGCVSTMRMHGHAGYSSSEGNPACAAVTLLSRSVARLVASRAGWTVEGSTRGPGNLSLAIIRRPRGTDDWLRGVSEILLQALADIDEEYPGSISLRLEEMSNGT